MSKENKMLKILLVEDNEDDIAIAKRAFKETDIASDVDVVRDGQEALDYVQHIGEYQDAAENKKPDLILLDINLPKVNGLEVLKAIKQIPGLKSIPVVMLSVSRREEDIARGYDYGCNSYIQKPVEYEKFVEAVKRLSIYWHILNVDMPRMDW